MSNNINVGGSPQPVDAVYPTGSVGSILLANGGASIDTISSDPTSSSGGRLNSIAPLSMYDFLQLISTTKSKFTFTILSNQVEQFQRYSSFFTAVATALEKLAAERSAIADLVAQIGPLLDQQGQNTAPQVALTTSTNSSIAQGLSAANSINNAITDYNSALSLYNSIVNNPNSTPQQITNAQAALSAAAQNYNVAVTAANATITNTVNLSLVNYASLTAIFNQNTQALNDQILAIIQGNPALADLARSLDLQNFFAFASLGPDPMGTQSTIDPNNPPLTSLDPYSDPIISSGLIPVPTAVLTAGEAQAKFENDFFENVILIALAALGSTSRILQDQLTAEAFALYVQKKGVSNNLTVTSQFVDPSSTPSAATAATTSSTTSGPNTSNTMGAAPNLVEVLTTGLLTGFLANQTATKGALGPYVPQTIIDAIQGLATSTLARVSLNTADSSFVAAQLQGAPLNAQASNAVAFFNQALSAASSSDSTLAPLVQQLLQTVPGITSDQVQSLTSQAVAAINIPLLLLGGLAASRALQDNGILGALLAAIPGIPSSTAQAGSLSNATLSQLVSQPLSSMLQKALLTQQLVNNNPKSANTAADSINKAVAQFQQAIASNPSFNTIPASSLVNDPAQQQQLSAQLQQNLVNQGISPTTAQKLSASAITSLVNQVNSTPLSLPTNTAPSTFNLASVGSPTASSSASSSTPSLALSPQDAALLTQTLIDTTSSNSFQNLIQRNVATLTNVAQQSPTANNKTVDSSVQASTANTQQNNKIADALQNLVSSFITTPAREQASNPNVLLIQLMDPANNVSKSFMTGLMYGKPIPTNFQKPLDIQV